MMIVQYANVVFLAILLLKVNTAQEVCPEGFMKHGESCYFFSSHLAADWIEAGSFCKRFNGGDLVAIQTQSENEFIYQHLLSIPQHRDNDFWIGGTDEFVEGHWVWISTMQRLGFTDWYPGNPSDSGSNEDCLEIMVGLSASPRHYWNDEDCSKKANFICEVPMSEGLIVG
ncbi:perlucin [Magallana gigas]|uniref:C-type lectin domain-containing protein n=1 Tax=Magallana gigas TaxID=29159 RepID=A0A8W8LJ47_MAGGI|nr:perlucin-like [Crassostrea gigas]